MRKILSAVTLFALAFTSSNASASDLRLYHVVKNGDSLSAIALAYKTSVKTLQELNNKRGEKIVIGSRIQVPWPDTQLAAAQDLRTTDHEVLPGDSLGSIAARYNSDAHCIRLLNALPDDRIRIGQKLRIPTTGPDYTRTDVAYTIAGGDTLGKIARNHELTTLVVRHLNPKVNWRQLKIGQTIRLVRWEEKAMVPKAQPEPTPEPVVAIPPRPEIVPVPAPVKAIIDAPAQPNVAPEALPTATINPTGPTGQ